MEIKKAVVLGSGVMGAGIAAHLANAGIPALLLDIVPPEFTEEDKKAGLTQDSPKFRNKFAINAINNVLPQLKPSPIFDKRVLKLITPGNFEDHMSQIKDYDWVIEVVVKRLDIKNKVFSQVEANMNPDAIISSNTSGIRLADLVKERSDNFKKNFMITHFFNPVRYMKLLEIVSGEHTDPAKLTAMAEFMENKLGKGVVYAKDTPSFVGNRIGVYGFMNALNHALEQGLSVEAVDKITGPSTGKAKSATFRTADLAGIDTLVHVANNNYEQCTNDECRDELKLPSVLQKLIDNKWLGNKTQQGFYKKSKNAEGKKEILSIDLKTGEYTPQEKVRYDSLGVAKNTEEATERVKGMISADDEAGKYAWLTTRDVLLYSANRVPEIADDVVNVDNAMKWGFNWELGPFETLDAIGVKEFAERAKADGKEIPAIIQAVLEKGDGIFYKDENGKKSFFDLASGTYKPVPSKSTHIVLKTLREQNKVIKSNSGASIIDLGDGVVNVEFHTKMNAIDGDVGEILDQAVDLVSGDSSYKGIVVSNDSANFSVGANLMMLWLESQQKNWESIEKMIKGFQDVCMKLKYSDKPVVAAPAGMALGGGCEVTMGCDAVRAHAETYIGLVEVGAGLIPGGGGCKNLLMNIGSNLLAKGAKGWAGRSDGGPFPKTQQTFETIAFAKVATSAVEGKNFGYLPANAKITMSRDQLLHDAKQDVLELAKDYQKPEINDKVMVVGEGGKMAMFSAIDGFVSTKIISEHDALIGKKLAHVLAGGDLPNMGFVDEQYLLDVERETFLSLCGEEKSQARMQSLLMTGKPLRN